MYLYLTTIYETLAAVFVIKYFSKTLKTTILILVSFENV